MSIKLTISDKRFAIVRPVMDSGHYDIHILEDRADWDCFLSMHDKEDLLVVDLETRGTLPTHPDYMIAVIGLASSAGSVYIDVREWDREEIKSILASLNGYKLVGHNIYFDAAGMTAYGIDFWDMSWYACTYILYKQLASEGFPGQTWGLKNAMVDMLGWPASNEEGIDRWLIENGYITDQSKLSTLDTPEKRLERWNERDKNGNRKLKPKKGEMWRVPAEILGHYCALDCQATYKLMKLVLEPALEKIPPNTWEFHQECFLPLVGILIDNLFQGITVDLPKMESYLQETQAKWELKRKELLALPEMVGPINTTIESWIAEIVSPEQFKKDGKISKNYEKYVEKVEAIRSQTHKDFMFNIDGNEMKDVMYNHLISWEISKPHEGPEAIGKIRILGSKIGDESVRVGAELEMTESGKLPMDESAFMQMGEIGRRLIEIDGLGKLKGYVEAGIGKAKECGDGKAHPQYRLHGTLTTRLAGGGNDDAEWKVNYQQLPGDEGYLSCYVAPPNHVLIQADVAALEPHVLAELSRDKTYMELYGPNAKSHDIYLFNGSKINKFKDKILGAGYDPDNKESIEHAKKECKVERNILKILTLSSSYGAGPFKIWSTLRLQGVDIEFNEVEQIHKEYWGPNLYGGVKEFQYELEREWRDNKGWMLDGLGCVVPISEQLKKDSVNRVIQGNGHRILMLFLTQFLRPMLIEAGINPWWYIPDLHDETIYAVPTEQAELALQVHQAAVDELNNYLGGIVKFKMDPKIIHNLSERKD